MKNTSEFKLSFHFDLKSTFIPSFLGQKRSLKSPKSTLGLSNPELEIQTNSDGYSAVNLVLLYYRQYGI